MSSIVSRLGDDTGRAPIGVGWEKQSFVSINYLNINKLVHSDRIEFRFIPLPLPLKSLLMKNLFGFLALSLCLIFSGSMVSKAQCSSSPTINGSFSICQTVTETYTTQLGMSNYLWSVSSGGVIVSGQGTYSVLVSWSSILTPEALNPQTLSVIYTDANGCAPTSPTTQNIIINLTHATITGNAVACGNSSGNVYSTENNKSLYYWYVLNGTITSGQGTNSIEIDWFSFANTGNVFVYYRNTNGCISHWRFDVNISGQAAVANITGDDFVCDGSSNKVYTTNDGMSAYNWTITGGVITSGQGTKSVTVSTPAYNVPGVQHNQRISVSYVNPNGCVSQVAKNVVIGAPDPSTIIGDNIVCANSTRTYQTTPGLNSYLWSVIGGSISSGQSTESVMVDWGANPQSIYVNYSNPNGCSSTPATKSITLQNITVPTIIGNTNVCQSRIEVYRTELGMTNYVWTVSNDNSIITGQGTSEIVVSWDPANGAFQTVNVSYLNCNGSPVASPPLNISMNITNSGY
jgi:hypothetical protein